MWDIYCTKGIHREKKQLFQIMFYKLLFVAPFSSPVVFVLHVLSYTIILQVSEMKPFLHFIPTAEGFP